MQVFEDLSLEISTISIAPIVNYKMIESVLSNSRAVIIQAFGMGNLPTNNPRFMNMLTNAINQGTICVIMTQCFQGEVNDIYACGRELVEKGAVLAYDMTLECIFAKLSYLIGKKYSTQKIKAMMMQSLRGELTDHNKNKEHFTLKSSKMVTAIAEIMNVTDQDDIKQINLTLGPLLVNSVTATSNLDLMKSLAAEGADFNNVDYRGRGPIHIAAQNGNLEICKWLIEQRVNLDYVDQLGYSALYLACTNKRSEVV
jgi:hypothetical protein